ncbi:unnamed protein product [Brassica oleracea var. botrytis]
MFPDLLTSDPESDILPRSRSREVDISLLPKIEYVEEGLGFTREEVAKMVVRSPALLTYSVDNNLAPKVEFLLEEMRGDGKEVKSLGSCLEAEFIVYRNDHRGGIDLEKVYVCMGDTEGDAENHVLKAER